LSLGACRAGGKDSTELVVRGERKSVPNEFVDELASFLGVSLMFFTAAGRVRG
jgi:hypothetical protein